MSPLAAAISYADDMHVSSPSVCQISQLQCSEEVQTCCTKLVEERLLLQKYHISAMGDMLGALAHQWRQPLNALAIMVQNIQDAAEYDDLTPEFLASTVSMSMHQIQVMSKTIDHFREFFRSNRPAACFDLKQAIDEVLFLVEARFTSKGIRVCFCAEVRDGRPYNVFGCKSEFKQVLVSLLVNAHDAIVECRGDSLSGGLITINLYTSNEKVCIAVSDTGGGIPEGSLGRIFDPYFTTKEQGKGVGMGLYIAKMVIERNMGGTLLVHNDTEGANFTIGLPAVG